MQPPDPNSSERTVNSYRIDGKLGAGGMGVVYKAWDTKLNRAVALKFLPAEIESDASTRTQFLREARAASGLDHPNIGTIHAIEETPEGDCFIVMAFYDGDTLAKRIRKQTVNEPQGIAIAIQMLRGLAEAHSHKIVHRDIKPSNVIIHKNGTVKIVDFGLARAIHGSQSTASSTSISGTAAYMSPEQAMGKGPDLRTDLWSMGVVLYEIMTGRHPFIGDSYPAVLMSVVSQPPAPLDNVPADLQKIIYRALAKDPAKRYQTANEMAAALEQYAAGAANAVTLKTPAAELKKAIEMASVPSIHFPTAIAVKPPRRWLLPALAAIIVVLLAAIAIPTLRQRFMLPTVAPAKHIAVLPFSVIGNAQATETLSDGLLESLTSKLSNLERGDQTLWVVPASEIRRRKVADPTAAKREFNVTLAVTGSIHRDGQTIRLTVNLIDTQNLRQLGSEELTDRTGDFALIQDSAIAKLARLLKINVTADMLSAGAAGVSAASYESYLQGLGLIQRYDKPGNIELALESFGRAIQSDPSFALAFVGQAEAYYRKFRTDQNPKWIEQASAACSRAAQLNDQLAPVHVTLGRIHTESGKNDLAIQEFQRAIQLDPRSPDALFGLASVEEAQGRFANAEQTLIRASALRPDYWDSVSKLGLFYQRQKRYAEALPQLQKVVALTPDNAIAWLNLAATLRPMGKIPEAIQALEKSVQLAPSYAAYANLGTIYYSERRYGEAAAQYQKALQLNDKDFRVWHNLAISYIWLNRTADAVAAHTRELPMLEKAATLRPQDPTLQSTLGTVYARLGNRAQAMTHIQAAIALAPKDPGHLASLAGIHEALGEHSKAIETVHRSLAAGHPLAELQKDPGVRSVLADPKFRIPAPTKN